VTSLSRVDDRSSFPSFPLLQRLPHRAVQPCTLPSPIILSSFVVRLVAKPNRDRRPFRDDVERPYLPKRVLREEELLRFAEVKADHDVFPCSGSAIGASQQTEPNLCAVDSRERTSHLGDHRIGCQRGCFPRCICGPERTKSRGVRSRSEGLDAGQRDKTTHE
jgi:hypothetical protein